MKLHLTDLAIRKLASPSEGQVDYWADDLKGFGIRVSCGGTKTFQFKRYNRRQSLGVYPFTTLKEARQEAFRRAAVGYRPIGAVPAQDAVVQYLKTKTTQKPATLRQLQWAFKNYFQFSGNLNDITAQQLATIIDPLEPNTATAIYSAFSTFFGWCLERDLIAASPIAKLRRPKKNKPRDRILTDDEIREIMQAAEGFDPRFGYVVLLLILTGQRLNQIVSLERSWVLEATTGINDASHAQRCFQHIIFPARIMKNNERHTIPFGKITSQVLKQIPDDPRSPYYFPADDFTKPFTNYSWPMRELRDRLIIPHFTLHDFRRYFSTTMAKLQVPIDVTEAILSHTSGSRNHIQRVYDHYDRFEPMARAMERYESHIASVLEIC